jgi:hypothetical protein
MAWQLFISRNECKLVNKETGVNLLDDFLVSNIGVSINAAAIEGNPTLPVIKLEITPLSDLEILNVAEITNWASLPAENFCGDCGKPIKVRNDE